MDSRAKSARQISGTDTIFNRKPGPVYRLRITLSTCSITARLLAVFALAFTLSACGGGGGGTMDTTTYYSVGGNVNGLAGTLVLQNNVEELTITADGVFAFATQIADGATYDVTVSSLPDGQSCTVTNGSGTISGANVTSVLVNCADDGGGGGADTTPPVITLLGSASAIVEVGNAYADPGATAVDDVDGDLTASVVVGGDTVDSAVLGTYVITYDVSDSAGNAAMQVARTVNVAYANIALPSVGAFYPDNGANWNDYVVSDGTNQFDAYDVVAYGSETGGYSAVIHGGEMRSLEVPGVSACGDLTATDALEAFDWACDDSTGTARMVSTGLKVGKNLSDLLDFATPGWLENSVTVTGTGVGLPFTTASTVWWGNSVLLDNDGGSLATSGTIYVVTANPNTAYMVDSDKVALVIQPGVTLSGPGLSNSVISASTKNFLWLEGTIDATGDNSGVYWDTVNFSLLRNLSASNAESYGVYFYGSSSNSLSNITAANNYHGVYLYESRDNGFSNVNAVGNRLYGVFLHNSLSNSLSNITASNNSDGVYLHSSSNNSLSNVTTANNTISGTYLTGSSGNSLSNVTAVNNYYGVYLYSYSNNNILSNITTANNGYYGVHLYYSSDNSLSNVTAANNAIYGVYLHYSPNNYFTGLLKVGNNSTTDCYVSGGTEPGLVNDTCANNGVSDATLTSSVTLASSFVGKVTIDDAENADDFSGTADYPADPSTFDWTSFENSYRGWGIDGSAFLNADNRGQWTAGYGRIWDWSLLSADDVITGVLAPPLTGDLADTITHVWSDALEIICLRNAVEIAGDSIGNDNGLCETDETCLYTPNIGSYQGHGALSSGVLISGDTITGVTLYEYPTNGY